MIKVVVCSRTLKTVFARVANGPVALNANVEGIPCPAQGRLALIFGFSPQPLSHENWNTMNEIKAGFRCSAD